MSVLCGCGRPYDQTPSGVLWHRQVHGHTPSPATPQQTAAAILAAMRTPMEGEEG